MSRDKKAMRFCIIIVSMSSIFYFWTRFWRFSSGFICPLFQFDSFSDFGLITILVLSFITALVLGINNIRLVIYPVFVATFVWLVPPAIYWLLYSQVNYYNLMYYMLYTFIFVFIGQLLMAYLGLGIGLLIFKIRIRIRMAKRNKV